MTADAELTNIKDGIASVGPIALACHTILVYKLQSQGSFG